ncbi:hypothetical protein CLOM_g6185 [Closterium sp. NIES-68]|nr:hypothetical protein CLOM_g6185 [Closterium sp. NIES-68]GJP67073.1 hypothetical protein CLOP_g23944 [Closterium sp. NIES-67]GJP82618.1 hypothetical protein CLOP_g12855 [Closterium sp. NIES-67]
MAPWVALALVGLLLGASDLRAARGQESFNYDLSGTDWKGLCQSGKKQSPINIVTSAVKRADGPSLLKVKHPLSREITVTNEEHAAAVSPQAGKRYYLTLPSGLHKLDHSDLQVPSIHLVNGVQAPMEAKFAYVNTGNTTRKSVFTVLLQLHPADKDNAWLDLWLNRIPAAVNGTVKVAAKTNFMELLSFNVPFWHYEGSQVHPPCTEVVDWFVSMRPKFVSTRQLATYMNFLSRTNSGDRTNNRLPQPLNGRVVSMFKA